jgi:hypothetical protein
LLVKTLRDDYIRFSTVDVRQHTIRRVQQKPRQFPSGAGERLREQRELRTADRVLILRQRSASGKIIQVARQAGGAGKP